MARPHGIAFASTLALLGSLAVVGAQQPTIKRTVLQRGDLTTAGHEAVMAKAELLKDGTTGRHTHPGEEVSYVLEGSVMLEVAGQPTRTVKAGDFFMIPAGVVHNAMNHEAASATILATYIVEKGKPLASPAP